MLRSRGRMYGVMYVVCMELRSPEVRLITLKGLASVSALTVSYTTFFALSQPKGRGSGPSTLKSYAMPTTQPSHISTGYSPYYLMFGIDPKLPIDLLLPNGGEEQSSNRGEWLSLHQNRLRDAHQQAQNKLRAEASLRKQQFDRHKSVKIDIIPIGESLHS